LIAGFRRQTSMAAFTRTTLKTLVQFGAMIAAEKYGMNDIEPVAAFGSK